MIGRRVALLLARMLTKILQTKLSHSLSLAPTSESLNRDM